MSPPLLRSLGRSVSVVLLAAAMTISGTSAKASSGADVAVKLGAVGAVFFAGARYTVTVTNNGPEPLTSATVTVQVDPRAYTTTADPPCPFDAATFTCTFGALPPGGTATLHPFAYFHVVTDRATLEATATRTASTPADPNAANDSDPATCWYTRPQWGQTWPPPTVCTLE